MASRERGEGKSQFAPGQFLGYEAAWTAVRVFEPYSFRRSQQTFIMEGNRKYMDEPNGPALKLREDDEEGRMIQLHGVRARVYSSKLWEDSAAILAIMREYNLDSSITTKETELVHDAFLFS